MAIRKKKGRKIKKKAIRGKAKKSYKSKITPKVRTKKGKIGASRTRGKKSYAAKKPKGKP